MFIFIAGYILDGLSKLLQLNLVVLLLFLFFSVRLLSVLCGHSVFLFIE